jgi:hypothetical protein
MLMDERLRAAHKTRIWLRRDLRAWGEDDRSISRRIRAGELVRVRYGAYVDATDWARLGEEGRFVVRGRAVLRASATSLVLSHTSALAEHGAPVWGLDLGVVHTTRTDGRPGRSAADIRQHEGRLVPTDVVLTNGALVTSPARAALESITCGSAEVGLCVVNHLLHQGQTTLTELNNQSVLMKHWPESRATELVLRLADERIESVGESRTLWTCFHEGLPMPVPQYVVTDRHGRVVARLDFAWPELRTFLEFDGMVKYERLLRPGERASDVVIRERDRERLVCDLTGWVCIRVTWADLAEPARLAARIARVLFRRTAA